MKTIPKTWRLAVPKIASISAGGLAGMEPTAYFDAKGRFRVMTYDPYLHGYFELGWDYPGQEESMRAEYE